MMTSLYIWLDMKLMITYELGRTDFYLILAFQRLKGWLILIILKYSGPFDEFRQRAQAIRFQTGPYQKW